MENFFKRGRRGEERERKEREKEGVREDKVVCTCLFVFECVCV